MQLFLGNRSFLVIPEDAIRGEDKLEVSESSRKDALGSKFSRHMYRFLPVTKLGLASNSQSFGEFIQPLQEVARSSERSNLTQRVNSYASSIQIQK